jgi:GT2 family glycosyltransferase
LKDLSVIIVNYQSWEKLAICLDSLTSVPERYFSFEVIIVDNASRDGKLSEFRNLYPQFSFILNQENWGFANGNNLGAARSRGKYLLFLNPDTIVSENAILAMLDRAKVSNANSIISCRQVRENGEEDKPYGVFPSPLSLTGFSRALVKALRLSVEPVQNDRFIFPDWVSGSVMMMSKTSFNRIGGWNERFWMYYEDVDLCRRAREIGGTIFLLKSVAVIHNHGGSSRSNPEIMAITKTEVIISRHEYISLHEDGLKEVVLHFALVLNNLIFGLLRAVPGMFLFLNRRFFTATRMYLKLLIYYFSALVNDTWLSRRSVMYTKSFHLGNSEVENIPLSGESINNA